MDAFYLKNAAQYQKLVHSLDVSKPAPHFSRHDAAPPADNQTTTETCNPDVIIAARIRPMLDADVTAGFPCAVYPRPTNEDEAQVIDLHDLYHHPTRPPMLKVCSSCWSGNDHLLMSCQSSKYQVDKLYDAEATAEEIYENLIADLVTFAQKGGIGTLFAYGQTGSGKTFTISQLQKLAVSSLMNDASDSDQEVYITICDLAGKSAFDLLASREPILILQDASGETKLAGAVEHRVYEGGEVLDLLEEAASFRRTAATLKNDASSRSHSICRIRMKAPNSSSREDGMLYLVDLAGSEAARDVAEHGADRMRETREINMSLSVLKDCVRGKAEFERKKRSTCGAQKQVRLPIRQSTLTRVLKHVFDPEEQRDCRTVVIACVNPNLADVGSSKNTLRYAEMLRVPVAS